MSGAWLTIRGLTQVDRALGHLDQPIWSFRVEATHKLGPQPTRMMQATSRCRSSIEWDRERFDQP